MVMTSVEGQSLSPLYDSKKKCLYCGKTFVTKKIRSKFIRISKRDSDFCNHYEGVNPYFYEVLVCTHCGFAFTENFRSIRVARRKAIKEQYIDNVSIPNLSGERSLADGMKSFKLAIFCATLAEENHYLLAGLCLKLAWLYRLDKNKIEEIRFLKNALKNYLTSYQYEDETIYNKATLLYLIGELEYRLNGYEQAQKWFSILISDKKLDPKIVNIAKERWQDIRYERAKD